MAEAKSSILLFLMLFLAILEATLSVNSEWKKFENGKVESEAHENTEVLKNKTEEAPEEKKKQHILHSHHGEKLKRLKDNNGKNSQLNEMDESIGKVETHKPNKDRHHRKNAEKMLHSGHRGEVNKQPTSPNPNDDDEQHQKQENVETKTEDTKEDEVKKKSSSNKRSKPEGISSIHWRRVQKEEERRKMAKAKEMAEAWLNKTDHIYLQKNKKKKYAITKMDGNTHAKKLWKEAFRGPNRLVLK